MSKLTVANEILVQLGGHRFTLMTGSKNYCGDEKSLTMKLIPNASKAKYLRITLNSMDLYDMVFFTVSKEFKHTIKVEKNGIYGDMLPGIFKDVTGLYTSLGTMGVKDDTKFIKA